MMRDRVLMYLLRELDMLFSRGYIPSPFVEKEIKKDCLEAVKVIEAVLGKKRLIKAQMQYLQKIIKKAEYLIPELAAELKKIL